MGSNSKITKPKDGWEEIDSLIASKLATPPKGIFTFTVEDYAKRYNRTLSSATSELGILVRKNRLDMGKFFVSSSNGPRREMKFYWKKKPQ